MKKEKMQLSFRAGDVNEHAEPDVGKDEISGQNEQ
jgi:hypothetical protein